MDKLKIFLAAAKKYQFWVSCGVMLVTSLACWWLASTGLASQYQARSAQIIDAFNGITNIPADPPNEGVIKKIEEQHKSLMDRAYSAWETLYTEQKKSTPFPSALLGEDFASQFERVRLQPKGQLADRYLERYAKLIKEYLPKLDEMIEIRHEVEKPAGRMTGDRPGTGSPLGRAGMGRGPGTGRYPTAPFGGDLNAEKDYVGIVDWNKTDHDELRKPFTWGSPPSTLEVMLAQEDIWVYEALLRVIKSVNQGATSQPNAAVKKIQALEIGKRAVTAWKLSEESVFRGSGKTGPGGGPSLPNRAGPPAGMSLPGGAAGQPSDQQLFDSRYVDAKGQPLPSEPEYPYARHPFSEYKMMPVRMSLVIDQRRLPKLLVACANSNMPIEIKRLRITKTTCPPLEAGGAATGPAMGHAGEPGPMTENMYRDTPAMGREPEPGGYGRNMYNSSAQETAGPFDVPVEIQAVIYIYNPPDGAKLGITTAPAANPVGATAPSPPAIPGKKS